VIALPSSLLSRSWALAALLALTGCATLPGGTASTTPEAGSAESAAAASTYPATASKVRRSTDPVIPTGPLQALQAVPPDAALTLPAVAPLMAPADLWERMRAGFAMNSLDGTAFAPLVEDRTQWYASRPEYLQRMTERASKYLFHIVEEVERRGLPMELALLPFVESAFNPQAVSPVKAAGMWQFMPATGQSFDLKQNAFRDDRRDVLASTRAALDYLEQLHERFGDWHLALAAYNWGQGNVGRAITRNERAGKPVAYTDLSMPTETRYYVPKLLALKNIVAQPARHNATLPHIGNHPFFDSVPIERDIDVARIAELANVSEADFRLLNPSFNRPVIMAAGTPMVLLPWDNAALFEKNLAAHEGPLASWTAWTVPRQMSPAEAAALHDMSEAELRQVNGIPPRMNVRAGSTLLVPRQGKLDRDVPEHVADTAQVLLAPDSRRVSVKVRPGDTLSAIARKHRVTVAQLREWNRLPANGVIRAGQTLVLHTPARAAAAPATPAARPPASRPAAATTTARTASTAASKTRP